MRAVAFLRVPRGSNRFSEGLSLAAGLGRVIRIIPDPDKDIGFNLLALVHYGGAIPTVTCKTPAEAETGLART